VQAHFIYLLESYCVLIVFVSVLIDQLGIPIPAVPVLIVAGSLAAHGKVSGVELLAAAVVATTGDLTPELVRAAGPGRPTA